MFHNVNKVLLAKDLLVRKKNKVLILILAVLLIPTFLLAVWLSGCSQDVPGADWPMWRYDAGRGAASPAPLPEQMYLQWVRVLPKPRQAWPPSQYKVQFDRSYEPVVMGKTIFVPSTVTDSVTAYDTVSGSEKWRFYCEGPVRFAPVAYKGELYFTCDDGYLYCVSARTGALVWKFRGAPADNKVIGNDRLVSMWPARGGPVIYDGKVYFAAGVWPFMGIFLYALDTETGQVIWTNSGEGANYIKQPHNSPAFAGVAPQGYLVATEDFLLVPGSRNVPACYDRKTGKQLYYHGDIFRVMINLKHRILPKAAGGGPVVARKDWFFNGGAMYNISDGLAVVLVDSLVVTDNVVFGVNGDGALTASSLEQEPKGLWKTQPQHLIKKIHVKAGSRIYGSGENGLIAAFDMPEPNSPLKISWQSEVEGDVWNMLAADNKLFVVTEQGSIYCFGGNKVATKTYSLSEQKLAAKDDKWTKTTRDILQQSGVSDGYCVVLGAGSGRLTEELLSQSKLDIIVVEPDARKVRDLRDRLYDLTYDRLPVNFMDRTEPVQVEWPQVWQVLGPFPKGSKPLSKEALETIPKKWTEGEATYTTKSLGTVEGILDFSNLYGGYGLEPLGPDQKPGTFPRPGLTKDPNSAHRTAYAFAEIDCPTPGRLTIGAGADWWMEWYLDGEPIYTTFPGGNIRYPFSIANHVFSVDISAGRHLLATRIRSGELSWMMTSACRSKIEQSIEKAKPVFLPPRRVFVHQGDPFNFSLPPYMASLIVSEDLAAAGFNTDSVDARRIFEPLRPYGGVAFLPVGTGNKAQSLAKWATNSGLENVQVSSGDEFVLLRRPGSLPDSDSWTHQYRGPAKTLVSRDKRVKAPLGLLWFGGPANDPILPRHGHGPSPQIVNGRLFIEGQNMLRAVDVYTGRLLWEKDILKVGYYFRHTGHFPGAYEIGSNYVSLTDGIYVMLPTRCLVLDPATGRTVKEFTLPVAQDKQATRWGSLTIWQDLIIATTTPIQIPLSVKEQNRFKPADANKPLIKIDGTQTTLNDVLGVQVNADYASASGTLTVMDRHSGKILWSRKAGLNFRHNNIAVAAGKIFCIDAMTPKKLAYLRRQGFEPVAKPTLYALDARTGDVVWENDQYVFGTWLAYSEEHDVLLQAGNQARDHAGDEVDKGMVVYKGEDGEVLWKNLGIGHSGPCMLYHDMIITQRFALDLLTGKRSMRKHPLTGQEIPWGYSRNYGCGTAVASEYLLTFRSAAAGYFDMFRDGGTGNLGGFKSGCTSNLIVADGVLNAPDYTRTCGCAYQIQSSMALVHMPEAEMWTFNAFGPGSGPVRQVGINFGAPGDRRADNGTLWLDYPSVGGRSPDISIKTVPEEPVVFRRHGSLISGDKFEWVAASGVRAVSNITIPLGNQDQRSYTVRLHFVEPDQKRKGERVFDVALQGKTMLKDFDIVSEAGSSNVAVVKEFSPVTAADSLSISLIPSASSKTSETILCGIELIAEGW